MVTTNSKLEDFILMDDGAIEVRPNARDFSRRFGPNPKRDEPNDFTAFLGELDIKGWGSNYKLTPVARNTIKYSNVNPKEYFLKPSFGGEELKTENILFIPYMLTSMENFRLSFPATIGKKSYQELSFILAMTINNLEKVEESDFKTAFNTFGRDATRFGFTDKLDYTTDNMQREKSLAYRVNIKNDHTIALPELKKGIQGLFKVYQILCEKVICDRKEAEQAAKQAMGSQENKKRAT